MGAYGRGPFAAGHFHHCNHGGSSQVECSAEDRWCFAEEACTALGETSGKGVFLQWVICMAKNSSWTH